MNIEGARLLQKDHHLPLNLLRVYTQADLTFSAEYAIKAKKKKPKPERPAETQTAITTCGKFGAINCNVVLIHYSQIGQSV